MKYEFSVCTGGKTHSFKSLKELMAKASPLRSGDVLAGIAAANYEERVAAQMCLADVPLQRFIDDPLIPYEEDEVTRLIIDSHNREAFKPIKGLSVGEFRDWLLRYETDSEVLSKVSRGITPEMAAAVSKTMSNQDLILVASKCKVVTAFRDTIGLKGRFSSRLHPNHPFDSAKGIVASIIDGLMYGVGDAVIGVNPATDNLKTAERILRILDEIIGEYSIPTQSCVLSHLTTTLSLMEHSVPVDLVFQSIGGTELTNKNFGVNLSMIREAREAALSLKRGTVGDNVMYFETGQGTALSANGHWGVDMQTCEARAYAVAREFKPLLVNTVVGFIGPEYLYDGKQIIRAGLEDHFCAKLLGLPMGCDVCYTNHADTDQDEQDVLLTLLAAAGVTYIMGIPGWDDIMLGNQTTSFHDTQYVRQAFKLRPAPEFEAWLEKMGIYADFKLLNTRDKILTRLLKDEN